ncbi:MAG: hypothetical protein KJ587_06375 [Alphaproteobacteria bacterium]|nr:hypothetical protein [Alphaproteobacteria bacterium]
MILRRLTKHVKDQNWFAVGLDFLIVVVGVGVALMGQQWLSDRQARSDYDRAVLDLRTIIFQVYGTVKERVSIVECRQARYRELGDQLMQTDTPWPGMAREYDLGGIEAVFPHVTRSPQRLWTSALWDAELATGTFDLMDDDTRNTLDRVFASSDLIEQKFQFDVSDMEANLQTLAYPLDLSLSDRLRYFDLLVRADAASATMELVARQNISSFEASGFLKPLNTQEATERREDLAQANARLNAVYDDCVEPMVYPDLELEEETE